MALVNGQATFSAAALAPGPHSITATYAGDADFNGSTTAAALSQTVKQAATATTVTAAPSPSAPDSR